MNQVNRVLCILCVNERVAHGGHSELLTNCSQTINTERHTLECNVLRSGDAGLY